MLILFFTKLYLNKNYKNNPKNYFLLFHIFSAIPEIIAMYSVCSRSDSTANSLSALLRGRKDNSAPLSPHVHSLPTPAVRAFGPMLC